MLASGGKDETVQLWDVATGQVKATFTEHTDSAHSIMFSPDGTTLASGSWDKTVRLWDVATGQLKETLEGHTDGVNSIAFSPDGTTLAKWKLRYHSAIVGYCHRSTQSHSHGAYRPSFRYGIQSGWQYAGNRGNLVGWHGATVGCRDRAKQSHPCRARGRCRKCGVQSGWYCISKWKLGQHGVASRYRYMETENHP